MPKNNTQKPQSIETPTVPKSYDACDMYDLACLAESDMDWMHTALSEVQLKIKQIQIEHPSIGYHFNGLEKILEMYVYLAENREQSYIELVDKYKTELKTNKKVVIL